MQIAYAECTRIANELHGGRYAPNPAEYEQFRDASAPFKTFIYKHFDGWPAFAAACGLTVGEPAYYYGAAKQRQEEWNKLKKNGAPTTVEEGRRRDEERLQSRGPTGLIVFNVPRVDTWYSKRDGKTYQGLAWEIR